MIEERAVCDVRRDPTATEETSRVLPDSDISSSRPRGGGTGRTAATTAARPRAPRGAATLELRSALAAVWLVWPYGRSGRFLISNIRTCGVSDRVSGDVRGMCVGRRTRCGTNKRTYRTAVRRGGCACRVEFTRAEIGADSVTVDYSLRQTTRIAPRRIVSLFVRSRRVLLCPQLLLGWRPCKARTDHTRPRGAPPCKTGPVSHDALT